MKQNFFFKQIAGYVKRRIDIIKSNSGVSHKRYISVTSARVLFLLIFVLLYVEIPANNVEILKLIVGCFTGVIITQSGMSLFDKKKDVDKKDNTDENNLQ